MAPFLHASLLSACLEVENSFPKIKPPKGKREGDKTPCGSSSMASKLLPLLERWQKILFLVFRLYQQQFLNCSIHKGLLDPYHLSLAGASLLSAPLPNTATGDGIPTGNVTSSVTISHVCGLRFLQWPSYISSFRACFPQ